MTKPTWLPEMEDVNGSWEDIKKRLYTIFCNDFKNSSCKYDTYLVWWDRRPDDGCDAAFWHLITRHDYDTQDRLFDNRRAERLPWCKPTIQNSSSVEVKTWHYRNSKKKIEVYVWLESLDYVVVMEMKSNKKFGDVAFLKTAFHVDGDSSRRNLQKKYEQREIL